MNKKAQSAGNSAILIIVITAAITLYILFLPPQDRAELLGETSITPGSQPGTQPGNQLPTIMTVLEEQVGRLEYLNRAEREYALGSMRISTTDQGSILKDIDSLYIKSSAFDNTYKNMSFTVEEGLTRELQLSFNTGTAAKGRLIVLLNGHRIHNDEIMPRTSKVLQLPQDILQRYNTLTFAVSSPGWAFWTVHEYQLSRLQITGTLTDVSGSEARQSFYISTNEYNLVERSQLRYFAECQATSVGRLTIRINGRAVFSGIPDCGVTNTLELDPWQLDIGENGIHFQTEKGTYLFTNVMIRNKLKEPKNPIYYFTINKDYFVSTSNEQAICGAIDGICPAGCNENLDKDCCFEKSNNHYWCDMETNILNDRCVALVTTSMCDRCTTGYEDSRGRAPEVCEGLCGDNNDGICPAGCNQYLDKDCCFENEGNYWCDDIPQGRPLSSVCRPGIEPQERDSCPAGYYDESGHRLRPTSTTQDHDEELRSNYKAELEVFFPNTELKSATFLINGREVRMQSRMTSWDYDISDYLRSGTNSIQILPEDNMDITTMTIKLKRR